ncbi:MAG: hypothetical protein LH603_12200 [Pseudonocardia sp.]|nr:hypothetical protein [Pseudonocardia sp.]
MIEMVAVVVALVAGTWIGRRVRNPRRMQVGWWEPPPLRRHARRRPPRT